MPACSILRVEASPDLRAVEPASRWRRTSASMRMAPGRVDLGRALAVRAVGTGRGGRAATPRGAGPSRRAPPRARGSRPRSRPRSCPRQSRTAPRSSPAPVPVAVSVARRAPARARARRSRPAGRRRSTPACAWKCGCRPVDSSGRSSVVESIVMLRSSIGSATKTSCSVMMSDSMRSTSVMCETRRDAVDEPSRGG